MSFPKHPGERAGNAARRADERYVGRGQSTYTPTQAVIARAKGARLWTVDGRTLYDFAAGVLVTNLGHNHPKFERYYRAYAKNLPRNSYNFLTPIENEAARRLIKSLRMANAQKLLWAASGAEGVQKAMWAALAAQPDRPLMVATRAGFHGKKGLANDVTGEQSSNPDVRWLSFPMSLDASPEPFARELDTLARKHKNKIALLITEPYLGARGSYHPPEWYHPMLQAWCRQHNIAFIFDEVQSCHGRTGTMYAFQKYGVQPDLVVLGKGLANGEPAAAVVGRKDLIDALDFGEASDTFSGNPHACAAVCAVLDVFEEDRVLDNVKAIAPILRTGLDKLANTFGFVTAVRGEGMVFGVEMRTPKIACDCVREAYLGNGSTGVHFLGPLAERVLRVSPPLTITESELLKAFESIEKAWRRI